MKEEGKGKTLRINLTMSAEQMEAWRRYRISHAINTSALVRKTLLDAMEWPEESEGRASV